MSVVILLDELVKRTVERHLHSARQQRQYGEIPLPLWRISQGEQRIFSMTGNGGFQQRKKSILLYRKRADGRPQL